MSTEMSESGASTSQAEASSDVDVEAATLLSQGRRSLLKGDAPSAVQSLQEACALLGAKYGELANECGESYYYYGWALLDLARLENDVLGNALDGVPDEEEDEAAVDSKGDNIENPDKVEGGEREKIFHDVQDALEDKGATDKKEEDKGENGENNADVSEKQDEKEESGQEEQVAASDGNEDAGDKAAVDEKQEKKEDNNKDEEEKPMEVADTDKKEDGEKSKEDGEKSKEAGQDEGAGPSGEQVEGAKGEGENDEGGEGGEGADGDDGDDGDGEGGEATTEGDDTQDEDVSNFRLSWEMLELARIIFAKQESENAEFKLKVSQVYLKLGELGLERGNYAQSIEDFTQCLTRQKAQLNSDSRLLAETHYNLALAYSFDQKFDKAIENFKESKVVIQNRIDMLKKKAEQGQTTSEEDLMQDQKEIKELEALVPEIEAKIEDAKAQKNTAESAVGQAMTAAAAEFGLGASSSSCFPQTSCAAQAKPIEVKRPTDSKPDDISHLVHRKRKPEEQVEQVNVVKKSRQEVGAGDAATTTTLTATPTPTTTPTTTVNDVNGTEQTAVVNGDAKHSPEKPEIKVKQVEQTTNGTSESATMET